MRAAGSERASRRRIDGYTVSWAVVVLACLVGLVALTLPAFELAVVVSADLGDGFRQIYHVRKPAFVPDLWPESAVALLATLSVVLVGVAALSSRRWEGVAVLASLVALFGVVAAASIEDQLVWPRGGGAIGFEEERAGSLLEPVVDDLRSDARRSPEARTPGAFVGGGTTGYNGRGLIGWSILKVVLGVVWFVTVYRTFRLVARREKAAAATIAASGVLWVVLIFQALSDWTG